ncbi:MAG: glycosyltransferase [Thermoanaerobaculia bacterium]|nr:glycosyltransferase [Thermoanaerobaculia bacterium]
MISDRPPLLTGVVVHWRDESGLARLLDAWPADRRFELLVVDNGGTLGNSGPELGRTGRIRRLTPDRNLGFAGGANLGARKARGDLLLLLNPDARPTPGALEALVEGAEGHPEAAGLVPRLVDADGEDQVSWQLRPLPRPGQLALHALFVDSIRGPDRGPEAGTEVAQPAAAALLLRRSAWREVGGMDESFWPAWFEDVDLARRLEDRSLPLLYWPRAVFRHDRAGSLPALGYEGFLRAYYGNLVRYLRKHHGLRWEAVGRVLVVVGMVLRVALLPLRRPERASTRGAAAAALLRTARDAALGGRSR